MESFIDIDAWKTTVIDFVRTNQAWAPFLVAGLAFGESIAVISLFVPATVLLVGIGALVAQADLAFAPIWLGAAVGAAVGDFLSYEVGRYFKDGAKRTWPLSRQPELVAKGEHYIQRYGGWAVVVGRFFGPIRAVVPLIAGIFRMPRPIFQAANIASAMVWAFVLLAFGDVFGNAASAVLGRLWN